MMTHHCEYCANALQKEDPDSDLFYKCTNCLVKANYALPCKFCNQLTRRWALQSTYCIYCNSTFYYAFKIIDNKTIPILSTYDISHKINNNKFELKFDLFTNKFIVFNCKELKTQIMSLDFLPDINPSNINEKLKTLLTFL